MGELAPTATCFAPAMRRSTTSIRSSSGFISTTASAMRHSSSRRFASGPSLSRSTGEGGTHRRTTMEGEGERQGAHSVRKLSRRAAPVDIPVEVLPEAVLGLRETHVFLEMSGILDRARAEPERPGAVFRDCHRLDIEARERRAREGLVLEQVALADLL